ERSPVAGGSEAQDRSRSRAGRRTKLHRDRVEQCDRLAFSSQAHVCRTAQRTRRAGIVGPGDGPSAGQYSSLGWQTLNMMVATLVIIFVTIFLIASAAVVLGSILLRRGSIQQVPAGLAPSSEPAETPLLLQQQLLSSISLWRQLLARFDFV